MNELRRSPRGHVAGFVARGKLGNRSDEDGRSLERFDIHIRSDGGCKLGGTRFGQSVLRALGVESRGGLEASSSERPSTMVPPEPFEKAVDGLRARSFRELADRAFHFARLKIGACCAHARNGFGKVERKIVFLHWDRTSWFAHSCLQRV